MSLAETLELLHPISRGGHILFGALGLVLFWFPLLTAKGQKRHRMFGRIFEAVAWIVVSLAGFGVMSYLIRFGLSDFSLEESLSEFSLILMLGGLTLTAMAMLYQGRAALKIKVSPKKKIGFFWALHLTLVVTSIALLIFGLIYRPPNFIVLIITSTLGLIVVNDGYQFIKADIVKRENWIYAHLNGMMGTGLAFYVAFGVFGSKYFFDTDTEKSGWANAMPWLLPLLVIIPLMVYWKQRVRSLYGDESVKDGNLGRNINPRKLNK
jgi:hypothetical protein